MMRGQRCHGRGRVGERIRTAGKGTMNDPGRQGWELVGLVPAADGMKLYFKRLTC